MSNVLCSEPPANEPSISASCAGASAPSPSEPLSAASDDVPPRVALFQFTPGLSQFAPSPHEHFCCCTPPQIAVLEKEQNGNFPDPFFWRRCPLLPCTECRSMVFASQPNVELWSVSRPSNACCFRCHRYQTGIPIILGSPLPSHPLPPEYEHRAGIAVAPATRALPPLLVFCYPAGPSEEPVYPATTTLPPPPARAAGPHADPYPLETTVPPSLGRGSAPSSAGRPAETTVPPTQAPNPPGPLSTATVSPTLPRAPVPPPPIRLEDRPAQSSKPPPPPPRLPKSKASFPRGLRPHDKDSCAATKKPRPHNSSKKPAPPPWENTVVNPHQHPNDVSVPKNFQSDPPPERSPHRAPRMNNVTVPSAQLPPTGNNAVPPAQLPPTGNGAAAPNSAMAVGQRGIPYTDSTLYFTPQQLQQVIHEKQRRYPAEWERKCNPPWICTGECGVCWMVRDAVFSFSNRGLPWCQRCCGVPSSGSFFPSRVSVMPLSASQRPQVAPNPTDTPRVRDARLRLPVPPPTFDLVPIENPLPAGPLPPA